MLLRLLKGRPEPPGEAAVTEDLLRCGFLPATARHLAPMLLRYDRGEFPELTGRIAHVLFIAWLRDHGVFSDELEPETDAANHVLARRAA